MKRSAVLLALLLGACAAVPPAAVPLAGQWGGLHVALVLTPSGGALDYDCAAGTIDQPLVPGTDGRFAALGRHTPGMGGPERIGEVRPSRPARYSGSVRGDEVTLTVRLDDGTMIGPYALRRGAEPRLMRCL